MGRKCPLECSSRGEHVLEFKLVKVEEDQELDREILHCDLFEALVTVVFFPLFEVHLLVAPLTLLEGVLLPECFEPGLVFELLVRFLKLLVIDPLKDVVRNLENDSLWNSRVESMSSSMPDM